jgi:hypothetical protein
MIGRCTSFLLAIFFLLNCALAQTVAPRQPLRFARETDARAPQIAEPVTHFPRFPTVGTDSSNPGLPPFARAAGTIFSGTVTRIEWRPAHTGQSVATVTVTFRVENAIRGVSAGVDLTISQWAGLWASGQRYRVGEKVLLFLYPNSKLGLTSWVGGAMGRFALDASGRVLLSSQQLSAFRRDPVVGGRSRVPFSDFALAVRRASEEE